MSLSHLLKFVYNNGTDEVIRRGKKIHAIGFVEFVENDLGIVLKGEKVPNPKYVRFGWANNPGKWTLYGENGRPLLPFRTDRLPLLTAANIFKFDPFSF